MVVYFHGESDDMYVHFSGSDEEDNNAGDDDDMYVHFTTCT